MNHKYSIEFIIFYNDKECHIDIAAFNDELFFEEFINSKSYNDLFNSAKAELISQVEFMCEKFEEDKINHVLSIIRVCSWTGNFYQYVDKFVLNKDN